MRPFVKFCSILALCTVTLLIFVNIVENSIGDRDSSKSSSSVEPAIRRKISTEQYLHGFTNDSSKKLLNLENFEYTIRPSTCNSTLLTWIVTSYAGDAAPRSALRRAYASEELGKFGITRVFLLGMLVDSEEKKMGVIQGAVRNEAERFDDIVQGNFYEAYRNLTYKHLMGLKWATENCYNARYIMKQDDDIVLNLYDIVERLRGEESKEIFAGYVLRDMKPVRERANKWFVTRDEFDGNTYPDFLSGWLYIVDREIAEKLVTRSRACNKYFWIDDVFLTGILRQEVNARLTDMHNFYTTDYRYLQCCIRGGERKNLKCEFAVGPNGGRVELQVNFQNFAASCRDRCVEREKKFSVAKTCVVEHEDLRVQTGRARIEEIQFL